MEKQYVQHMIAYASSSAHTFSGKRVAISGSGNVAQYAALKALELGATVLSLSDSQGCLIACTPAGITAPQIEAIAALKVVRKPLSEIATTEAFQASVTYIAGARPWVHVGELDVALPCATQNEVSAEEAEHLVRSGARFVAEGSNMGCEEAAIEVFEAHRKKMGRGGCWYGPGSSLFPPLFSSPSYPNPFHHPTPHSQTPETPPLQSLSLVPQKPTQTSPILTPLHPHR